MGSDRIALTSISHPEGVSINEDRDISPESIETVEIEMYHLPGDPPPLKEIDTLVEDIYNLFREPQDVSQDDVVDLGSRIASCVSARLSEHRGPDRLRISNFGVPCDRQLWLKINEPREVEPLKPETLMMFLIGDIIELIVLFLAKQAGHDIQGQQDELNLEGVLGHRDAVIDGRLCDAKSASPFSFEKFEKHNLLGNDPFGYVSQLGGYLEASQDDPLVKDKTKASFLVINKVTGEICLDTYDYPSVNGYRGLSFAAQEMISGEMPQRAFSDKEFGKSGNRCLGTECKYCSVKFRCFDGLREFDYSNGPVYLTVIKDLPKVPEVTRSHAPEVL